jgi:hypothetical protein
MTERLPRIDWSADITESDWVVGRLHEAGEVGVGSLVPRGFESYARVLHPARDGQVPVRWRDVAALTGRALHPLADFADIAQSADRKAAWTGRNPCSSLSHDDVTALIDIAGKATATPDSCWFCLWEGYGWLYEDDNLPASATLLKVLASASPLKVRWARREQRQPRSLLIPPEALSYPRVHGPCGREYLLYQGPISTASVLSAESWPWKQTPNLWWPAGREWCVATEIDLYSTYIGGSEELIAAVLDDQRLEALRAQASDPITS